jgi:glutathione S-transferase
VLIDSTAILDYLNELAGPRHALVPCAGPARRSVLRLSVISTTLCEVATARHFEQRRPGSDAQPELLERYRLQIIGGLKALDGASSPTGPLGLMPLDVATISAVVTVEYLARWYPELDVAGFAPALAAVARTLADNEAIARTRSTMT